MHIGISGGTGFAGQALINELLKHGYKITNISRSLEKSQKIFGSSIEHITRAQIKSGGLESIECMINLAGYPIDSLPRTKSVKNKIYNSRIETTKTLINNLPDSCSLLINASATGYYPSHKDKIYTEQFINNNPTSFLEKVCIDREFEAHKFNGRVITLRSGIILGDGKFEAIMRKQARIIGGVILGDGHQYLSLIKLEQRVDGVIALLQISDIHGPINMVTDVKKQKEYITTLADNYKKHPWIRIPSGIIRLLLGSASTLFLGSQYCDGTHLQTIMKKL